ncbi:MAG: polyphosphate polymerase domain-containing protein [Melioribacteraceae bacterium]|nr:polyphosphate polymerase domain-containing protein [Melioribacteraceae bacterium]
MMRREYKYRVPVSKLDEMRKALEPFVKQDVFMELGQNNEYTVRSIYYDSPTMTYYKEKIHGLKNRKKVRVRGYNLQDDESVVFLEVKRKDNEHISKNRCPVSYSDIDKVFETKSPDYYVLDGNGKPEYVEDGKKFFYHIIKKSLNPVVLIVYEREAFYSKFDKSLRITFDKNLRYHYQPDMNDLYSDSQLKNVLNQYFVLEIKFEKGYPVWLQKIVQQFGLKRTSVSKYQISLDDELKKDNKQNYFINNRTV